MCRHITEWYKFGVLLKLDTTKPEGIRVMNKSCSFKIVKMFELSHSSNTIAIRREI